MAHLLYTSQFSNLPLHLISLFSLNFVSFPSYLLSNRNISDYDEDGQLNEAEFSVALHLAQLSLKHDITIPSVLPEELRLVLQQATRPQLPMAKPTQLLKCSSAFLHFCENLGGQGYLKGILSHTHPPKTL